MDQIKIPDGYQSALNLHDTQIAIKTVKDFFQQTLSQKLNLLRVSAPVFVNPSSGLNDNLNGVERPVSFDIKGQKENAEIVHSLAKWKRYALQKYGFAHGEGLYTDMIAIRRDEDLDNIHSVYVDQWDWEKVITKEERTEEVLEETVRTIFKIIKHMEHEVWYKYPQAVCHLADDVFFITSQQLEDLYPDLSVKDRENAITREHKCVFIKKIGKPLTRSGRPHDGRAPDYDDWDLNGDLLFWLPSLNRALEISSMGIRVDEETIVSQCKAAHCEGRLSLPYHQMIQKKELPYTIGGGIGQSRLCMLLLNKAHVGEVQASIWPDEMIEECEKHNIHLL